MNQNNGDLEIPENLYSSAEANYFCNVCEFISLGERRPVDKQGAGRVKRTYSQVEDWFESLDDAGKERIIQYLEFEPK